MQLLWQIVEIYVNCRWFLTTYSICVLRMIVFKIEEVCTCSTVNYERAPPHGKVAPSYYIHRLQPKAFKRKMRVSGNVLLSIQSISKFSLLDARIERAVLLESIRITSSWR